MATRCVRLLVRCGLVAATVCPVFTAAGTAAAEIPSPEPPIARTLFTPLVPARLADTRPNESTIDGLGRPNAPVQAAGILDIPVLGRGGVPPTGVSAVVLNVTVTNPTAPSFLTVWPAGASMPTSSNLNFTTGQTVPNLVVAKLGTGGVVRIFNRFGTVDVIADVAGYFPETDGFVPVQPARLLDTRPAESTIDDLGRPGGPLGPDSTLDLEVLGRGKVPSTGVDAIVLNVTATSVTAPSFLTVWPSGAPRPTTSNLNLAPGQTVPNLVVAKIGAAGKVSIYNGFGSTDVIADVAGYFPTDGAFVAIQPARVYESRAGEQVTPGGEVRGFRLSADETDTVKVTGLADIPADGVAAVVLNVTAVNPTAPSFLTVWPHGFARPGASNLNLRGQGEVVPNLVLAKVGAGGKVDIYNLAGSTDVIVDVAGYFLEENGLVRDVVTSERSTCVLDDLGRVTCWGEPAHDPTLAYDLPFPRTTAYALHTFDDAVDLAIGLGHACVIRTDGTVWCWARSNNSGLAGNGSNDETWPPVRVPGLDGVVEIDAGVLTTCGLQSTGVVSCWGSDFQAAPPDAGRPREVNGLSNVVDISVDDWSACALHADGRVSCWGRQGSTGVLGDGSGTDSATPRYVAGLHDADSIDVGSLRACATRTSGEAVCWGNSFLGGGSTGRSLTPVGVLDSLTGLPADDILQVVGGDDYACALRFDDQIYCWGSESAGSLGLTPSSTSSTVALTDPVPGLPPIVGIIGERFHFCAVSYDLELFCWGFNAYGQVGDGTVENRAVPTYVLGWT